MALLEPVSRPLEGVSPTFFCMRISRQKRVEQPSILHDDDLARDCVEAMLSCAENPLNPRHNLHASRRHAECIKMSVLDTFLASG